MNGYVLAWMAVSASATSLPALGAGILIGRRAEWSNAYGAGEVMGEYQGQNQTTATAQLAQLRQQSAASTHDHEGPCSAERGCY